MHEVTTTLRRRVASPRRCFDAQAIEGEEEMREVHWLRPGAIATRTRREAILDCSRGNMHPHFDEVAFGLKVGELSDQIVETDSGLHLLLRIG